MESLMKIWDYANSRARRLSGTESGVAFALPVVPLTTDGTIASVSYDTSAQSAAITGTSVVLTSTTDCHARQGANPTADTGDDFLPANTPRGFTITSGNKIAAIKATGGTAGLLHISLVA